MARPYRGTEEGHQDVNAFDHHRKKTEGAAAAQQQSVKKADRETAFRKEKARAKGNNRYVSRGTPYRQATTFTGAVKV